MYSTRHYTDPVREAYSKFEDAAHKHETYLSDSDIARRHERMLVQSNGHAKEMTPKKVSWINRIFSKLKK